MLDMSKLAIIFILLSMVLSGCATDPVGASDHPSQASAKEASVNPTKPSTESSQPTTASGQANNNKTAHKAVSNPESLDGSSGTTTISLRTLAEIHKANVELRDEMEKMIAAMTLEKAARSVAQSDLRTTTAEMQSLAKKLLKVRALTEGGDSVSDGPTTSCLPNYMLPAKTPPAPNQGDGRKKKDTQYFDDAANTDDGHYVDKFDAADRILDSYGKLPEKPQPPVLEYPRATTTIEDTELPQAKQLPITLNINVNPSFRDIGKAEIKGSGNSGDVAIDSPVTVVPEEDEEELSPAPQRVPVHVLPRPPSSGSSKVSTSTTATLPKSLLPTPATTTGQKSVGQTSITTLAPKAASPSKMTTSSQKGEPPAKPLTPKSSAATPVTSATKPVAGKVTTTSAPATQPTTKVAATAKRHRQRKVEEDELEEHRSWSFRRGQHPSVEPSKPATSPCDWLKQYPELEGEIRLLGEHLATRRALSKRAVDLERRIEILRARVK